MKVYRENGKIIVTNTVLGLRAGFILSVAALKNREKANKLYIKINNFGIEFYDFFLEDVIAIVDFILVKYEGSIWIRRGSLLELKKKLQKILNAFVSNETIDYSRMHEEMNYKILKHQQEAFDDFENSVNRISWKGTLIRGEVGSGKTFMSLGISVGMHAEKVIIVCPNQSIDRVWIRALTTEGMFKEEQSYYNVKTKNGYNGEKYIICNYEALAELQKIIKDIHEDNVFLIVDEIHNLTEKSSNRTNRLLEISEELNPKYITLLSGTPIKARPSETIPIIQLLDKRLNKYALKRFKDVIKGGMPGVIKESFVSRFRDSLVNIETPKGENNRQKHIINLNVKLPNSKQYLLSTIKVEIEKYIDDRTHELNELKPGYDAFYLEKREEAYNTLLREKKTTGKEYQQYTNDVEKIIAMYKKRQLMFITDIMVRASKYEKKLMSVMNKEDKKKFAEAKTIYKYLALKIIGEVLGRVIARKRIDCHADMAKAIDYKDIIESTTKKTIIFSNYIKVANVAMEKLKDEGYTPAGVYGETTKNLTSIVGKFMDDDKTNPLVTSYKSLAESVPLIVANVSILLDLPFREYTLTQAMGRTDRQGQDKDCYYYIVRLDTGDEPNINDRNVDIVEWSKEMVEEITGISSEISIPEKETNLEKEIISKFKDAVDLDYNKFRRMR